MNARHSGWWAPGPGRVASPLVNRMAARIVSPIFFALIVGLAMAVSASAAAADEPGRSVIGANPDLTAGEQALRSGDYVGGIELTQRGLRSEHARRQRAGALSNLCAGYVGLRDYDAALEYCNQALELNEHNWRAYNNRALALLGTGYLAAARRDLEAGLALNPESSTLARVAELIAAREARHWFARNDSAADGP